MKKLSVEGLFRHMTWRQKLARLLYEKQQAFKRWLCAKSGHRPRQWVELIEMDRDKFRESRQKPPTHITFCKRCNKQLHRFAPAGPDELKRVRVEGRASTAPIEAGRCCSTNGGSEIKASSSVFTCPQCGWHSYHPKDVEHSYCGNCHQFFGNV